MDPMLWICSLVMGAGVAGCAYFGNHAYSRFVDFVERDLADRLRSLRVSTPYLRRWINVWLALVAAAFLLLWLGLRGFTLALCLGTLLSAGPWYLVRRMALRRRQKIEDQLADGMVMFSSAVRAGLSIPQSLEILSLECRQAAGADPW
ncbi:MAG: hypothetical protein NTY19_36075 [Planctomycetota bacterium]|nr:hypothetical protein [Planctomycetota bacterium]